MELRLGRHAFDVSTQAVVIADGGADFAPGSIEALSELGAAAVHVSGPAQMLHADVPIIATAMSADEVAEWVRSGASAIAAGLLSDPHLLPVIADTNASVVISDPVSRPQVLVERARWAQAAGLSKSQIIVEVAPEHVGGVSNNGYHVMVTTRAGDASAQGTHVSAAMAGARLIRSNDVRATKRTLSTVSELLQRRGVSAPGAVEFAGAH